MGLGTSPGDKSRGCVVLPASLAAPRSLRGRERPRSVFTHRLFWVPNVGLDARRGWEKPLPASPAAPDGVSAPGSAPGLVTSNPLCPTGVHAVRPRALQGWPQVRARQRDKSGRGFGGAQSQPPGPPRWCGESDGAKETPLKFLLPLFCPSPHTALPASTHARTHALTHTHAGWESLPQLGGTGLQ